MINFLLKIAVAGLCLLPIGGCAWLSQARSPQLTAQNLAVIVNDADALSVQIGAYYQRRRRIPPQNLITIRFTPGKTVLTPEEFKKLRMTIEAKLPQGIEGYALTWAAPYRVGCMSITSAFALGFDQSYCADGCTATATSPLFNQRSWQPYQKFNVRPTMMLAATRYEQAKQLIDRGVDSDGTFPPGTAYLVSTTDKPRNVRSQFYNLIKKVLGKAFKIEIVNTNNLENKQDVMFYFTGLEKVEKLDTLQFRPGAIADHLTSWGGALTDSSQMSSLRWLEAGATGSYGTVVEPCNFPQKFPHPGILMQSYLQGDTLLESYWHSVAWPGQGVFIGEPLARPFGKSL